MTGPKDDEEREEGEFRSIDKSEKKCDDA